MSGEKREESLGGSEPTGEVPVLVCESTETLSRKDLLPSESEEAEEVRKVEEKAEELSTGLSEFEFAEDFSQIVVEYFAQYPNVLRGGPGVVDEGLVVFSSAVTTQVP